MAWSKSGKVRSVGMHGSKAPTSGQIINENFVAEAVDDLHTGIDDQDNMARPIDNTCIISHVPVGYGALRKTNSC